MATRPTKSGVQLGFGLNGLFRLSLLEDPDYCLSAQPKERQRSPRIAVGGVIIDLFTLLVALHRRCL